MILQLTREEVALIAHVLDEWEMDDEEKAALPTVGDGPGKVLFIAERLRQLLKEQRGGE